MCVKSLSYDFNITYQFDNNRFTLDIRNLTAGIIWISFLREYSCHEVKDFDEKSLISPLIYLNHELKQNQSQIKGKVKGLILDL